LQCELSTSNPINTSTGNKYLSESDYRATGLGGLHFNRFYNSQNTAAISSLGTAWRHAYDSVIASGLTINGAPAVLIARSNGMAYAFTVNSTTTYTSQDADVTDKLIGLTDTSGALISYQYTVAADNSIETYNAAGKLTSIQHRSGLIQTLTYSDAATPIAVAPKAGLLIRITDAFGRQLNFTYDSSSRISTMTDPAGSQFLYSYDAGSNLALVTYPDNKTKTYLYNEATYTSSTNLPHALTGITDENGVRYASYFYNAQGKAYLEHQAGGVNQYQISYSSDGSSSTITDPLGTVRTTSFTTILGAIKATGQSQPGGAGCGPASSAMTYDANGNVASRTDFNGIVTTYQYDLARNLEASRTEAAGTALARTITTQWHSTWHLPAKIAEPKRITTFAYDATGNLLTKTLQATTDANGAQAFSATVTGTARTWTYTYNNVGQVLTVTGPRTDVVDRTTFTYDTSGNLVTITNAKNQATTLSNYDANGKVGRITDPNGVITDLTYSRRGWLLSRIVTTGGTSKTTAYDYDGVGQLIKVTLPDASTVAYTYDAAHRLTHIADRLGNSIAYTLDAMGNRTDEQIKDPSGTLVQQTSRIFDALNRLQQLATRSATTNYQYDAMGNPTQITDPLGRVTNQSYDALNRLIQQLQPAPAAGVARPTIGYAYDGQDQLVSVTDPRNLVTSYTVDGLGNQSKLVGPDTGTTNQTFDAAGNVKTSTDARGKITTYSYDVLNRITSIAYGSGTATTFEYDGGTAGAPNAMGRLTKMTDESGQTTYTYNAAGLERIQPDWL
jgi:YD repeat-containing protein